jgi:hypothetical protein
VGPGGLSALSKLACVDSVAVGDLVTLTGPGAPLDGLVFDTPSRAKAVVAVVDPQRGPMFRIVHPRTLTARAAEGGDDAALRLLVRRTPAPTRGSGQNAGNAIRGSAGFARGSSHRTTGK